MPDINSPAPDSPAAGKTAGRPGRNGAPGIGLALALSAAFHLAAFFSWYWLLPVAAAPVFLRASAGVRSGRGLRFGRVCLAAGLLTVLAAAFFWVTTGGREEAGAPAEAVIVRLLPEAPPEKAVEELPEIPDDPPTTELLAEAPPPPELQSPPPPALAKIPPPTVTPPRVAEPPPPPAARRPPSGPAPMSGLSEAAAARLLGRSLGLGPGPDQMMASPSGLGRDEEMERYLEAVRRRIRQAWKPVGRAMAATGQAGFELRLEPDGRVSSARMTRSSGNRDFDRSAEQALKKAAPLPPLPSVFGGRSAILDLSLNPAQMR